MFNKFVKFSTTKMWNFQQQKCEIFNKFVKSSRNLWDFVEKCMQHCVNFSQSSQKESKIWLKTCTFGNQNFKSSTFSGKCSCL